MKYYRVTGTMVVAHRCNCRRCTLPEKQAIDASVVVPGPDEYDEFADAAGLGSDALNEKYREMGLVDETDNLYWDRGTPVEIREARPDEVMVKIGAPRLPGFEEK